MGKLSLSVSLSFPCMQEADFQGISKDCGSWRDGSVGKVLGSQQEGFESPHQGKKPGAVVLI